MIKAYINGIAYELDADFSITEQAANKVASDIAVLVADQPVPQSGDIIEIRDDDMVYFLGLCGIPKSPKYKSPFDVKRYSITCTNANGILSRRMVNVAYKEYTITQIVQDLFNLYVADEGFTLGEISDIPITLNVYTAADYNLQFCLNELAEYVQGSWYCTNDRKFYFIARDDFEEFPEVIEGDFIPITDLQVCEKDTDVRTNQIVTGGTSSTLEQTESRTYDGDENNFTVAFTLSLKPRIFVNGAEVDPKVIGVRGYNDGDDRIMFLFAFNSPVITYNSGYTGILPEPLIAGDVLVFKYVGQYPIRIEVRNQAAIAEIAGKTGTSGIIDNVRLDKQVIDTNDAVALGNSLLQTYSKNRNEIKGWITVRELRAMGLSFEDFALLKKWTFNLPQYGAVGEYVLVERTLSPLGYETAGNETLKISLKLVDRAFMKSYAEVLNELSKAISQLSIRKDDIVIGVENIAESLPLTEDTKQTEGLPETTPTEDLQVTESLANSEGRLDTSPEETIALSESQGLKEYMDFMPLWCTSDASGVLMCPEGLSLEMISEQHFSEVERAEEALALSESSSTSEGALDTQPDEILGLAESSETSEGAPETTPAEMLELSEFSSTAEGALDTAPTETLELAENITQTEGQRETAPEEKLGLTEQQIVDEFTDFMVLWCTSEAQFSLDGQILSPTGLSTYAWSTQL